MKKNSSICLAVLLCGLSHSSYTSAAANLFSGSGAAATTEFEKFKVAIKTATGVDGSKIGWDGVKLDGTDANPNTKIIVPGKTVEIPVDRFKNLGVIFADPYTVSGDDFVSVNPGSFGQFPAFSPKNTFAMFDPKEGQFEDRNIQQAFVLPNTLNEAGSRGFGAIFLDTELYSSSIEYFGKDAAGSKISLGKYYVKPGADKEPQFLGVLFDAPVISEIEITVGSKALFNFNGTTFNSFGAEDLAKGVDLVVTDDFFFAVPETLQVSKAKISDADCLLNWAEKHYPSYLDPAGANTRYSAPYSYRYYPYSKSYLGVSYSDNNVYYLEENGVLIPLGPLSDWLTKANCQ